MRKRLLIGLVGPANAGKDMVASYMESYKDFKRFAFADRIKQEYYAAAGLDEDRFKQVRGTPEEAEMRRGLWDYSDRMRAEKGDLHFVNLLMAEVEKHGGNAIITDIRTPDELAAVREAGGKIVFVVRQDALSCEDHERIPDSRLTFGDIGPEYEVFRNTGDGLRIAHWKLEMFYRDYILCEQQERTEGAMDADSDPGKPCSEKSEGTPASA
jgi:hypothetical protein